ncbi:UDP-glucuronosyltransferase 2B17-like isoform X2 [Peromyscus leucopus]|uniref:UDP-glucuronosyltransferase 2B17-like isoform X2 n=1 Tax=Peromyscus leucopus TaxID=10041 RepID=UPI0010A1ACD8|nr:UDP-glucuronosyltransferase 2B17-like isoform X2 [Peromyscus leucopus]
MPVKWMSVLLLLQMSCYFRSGNCGKVLVWPMEFSHWLNLKIILDELAQRGHEVTVLRPASSIFVDPQKSPSLKFETFPTSLSKDDLEKYFNKFVDVWTYEVPRDTCLSFSPLLQNVFDEFSDTYQSICEDTVTNKQLMTKLQNSKFDVLFSDAIGPCGELIAELLQIPFLYSLRFTPGYTMEKYSGGLTLPPSYVPMILSGLGGQMTFMERVRNMICMLYFNFWSQTFNEKKWSQFYSETLGRPTTLAETRGKAQMWLIRSYWDLEFPHPTLPNVDYVGGLHCKPAKPLPKVLWRFDGKTPDTLGPNTRVYKWLPQNDLLGHPKTKAFVTHGGANGVYEAIHFGIPMVGIPLFGEQHDNIANMVAKGAAVALNIRTMSRSDLLNALEAVIENPSYKENAMWLSTIHHDQLVKPLDRAIFWIEFVMRHKGAKHLRPLAFNLTWYQYHSLDVIGFLLACVAAMAFLAIKFCSFIYQKFIKMGKKMKNE